MVYTDTKIRNQLTRTRCTSSNYISRDLIRHGWCQRIMACETLGNLRLCEWHIILIKGWCKKLF